VARLVHPPAVRRVAADERSRRTVVPKKTVPNADTLAQKAAEVERIKDFVDRTTFAGDQREASDELSVVDQHPADVADITMQREVDFTIKKIVEEEGVRIQEALARQAQGQYGICEGCEQPIPRKRLEARPHATLCISCQRLREHPRR
jgi:RNA polymerase-binding transcription factor DksA